MSLSTLIGTTGVVLLLLAFFLNLIKRLPADHTAYLGLNFIGAALACYSSYLIAFMPFVVLEGTWALVAAAGLIRTSARSRRDR